MTSNKPPEPSGGDEILIALGANIPSPAGSPARTLKCALAALEQAGLEIVRLSPFYETAAWPDPDDPPFVNAVAVVGTALQPFALLRLLHEVETAFGRKRSVPNAPRTLDIDLIAHGRRIEAGEVRLPHPRLAARRFVLEPLAQVAPGWRHPVSGLTVETLLESIL